MVGHTGAAGVAFGAVAPASAQPLPGQKRPTPKKVGADRMPARNFAPVVSKRNLRPGILQLCVPTVLLVGEHCLW